MKSTNGGMGPSWHLLYHGSRDAEEEENGDVVMVMIVVMATVVAVIVIIEHERGLARPTTLWDTAWKPERECLL